MIGLEPAPAAGRSRPTPASLPAAVTPPHAAGTAEPHFRIVCGRFAGRDTVAPGATGVALRCIPGPDGRPVFQVALMGTAAELGVVFEAPDDSEVIAVWRRAGSCLGLPLLIVGMDGGLGVVSPQLGLTALGPTRPRRRNATLSKRRPRMMMRRKPGRFDERTRVFREREIIARS
jgi:hypothetical protein